MIAVTQSYAQNIVDNFEDPLPVLGRGSGQHMFGNRSWLLAAVAATWELAQPPIHTLAGLNM
jgi:hypothetical protein